MTNEAGRAPVEVVEYTDPLCPWAWGSEPVFRGLRAALGGRVHWRRVYCILFDHDDDPAPDPAAETAWYSRYVEDICGHTHAPRAYRLGRVAASSWPVSLVAKAAELQGTEVADRVLRRLRESVFVLGEPADTPALALSAARGVPGLDHERLAADAASTAVLDRVRADRAEARRPVRAVLSVPDGSSPHPGAAKETPDGGHRYALPTLLFRSPMRRPRGARLAVLRGVHRRGRRPGAGAGGGPRATGSGEGARALPEPHRAGARAAHPRFMAACGRRPSGDGRRPRVAASRRGPNAPGRRARLSARPVTGL